MRVEILRMEREGRVLWVVRWAGGHAATVEHVLVDGEEVDDGVRVVALDAVTVEVGENYARVVTQGHILHGLRDELYYIGEKMATVASTLQEVERSLSALAERLAALDRRMEERLAGIERAVRRY